MIKNQIITFVMIKIIMLMLSACPSPVQHGPWYGALAAGSSPRLAFLGLLSLAHGSHWTERTDSPSHQPLQTQPYTLDRAEKGPLLSLPVPSPQCPMAPLKQKNIKGEVGPEVYGRNIPDGLTDYMP